MPKIKIEGKKDFEWLTITAGIVSALLILSILTGCASQPSNELTKEDKEQEARRLLLEGSKSAVENQREKAIDVLQRALALYQETHDQQGEADTLSELGIIHESLSHYTAATNYSNQALEINLRNGNLGAQATNFFDLGTACQDFSHYDQADFYFQQALSISRQVTNEWLESGCLISLGLNSARLGEYDKAIEIYNQELLFARKKGYNHDVAAAMLYLGEANETLGSFDMAIAYYNQALTLGRQYPEIQSVTLTDLGGTYCNLGRALKALEFDKQALILDRQYKSRTSEGVDQSRLGGDYFSLGSLEKAMTHLRLSLAISRETGNRRNEGNVLAGIGLIFLQKGKFDLALTNIEQGLSIIRETRHRTAECLALNDRALALNGLKRNDEAMESLRRGLAIAREIKYRDAESAILGSMMSVQADVHQFSLAILFGKQSINILQELRKQVEPMDEESRRRFLESHKDTYRRLAELLISQQRLAEAEQVLGMLKEHEYFDYLHRDRNEVPSLMKRIGLNSQEALWQSQDDESSQSLATLGDECRELTSKNGELNENEKRRLALVEKELNQRRLHFEQMLKDIESEAQQPRAQIRLNELDKAGIQDELPRLGDGVVAIYTLLAESNYWVILVTPSGSVGTNYPITAANLSKKVFAFRELLQEPNSNPKPAAKQLYKILVGPIERELTAAKPKTTMWSLDGVLRYLPTAALYDGNQYLVERFSSELFTLGSLVRLERPVSSHWNALGLGMTNAVGKIFDALPNAERELRQIIKTSSNSVTGVMPGVLKLNQEFTADALKAGLRQKYEVVHIASHFALNPSDADESFLLLGDGNRLSLKQFSEVGYGLQNVELLTLSACSTAIGSTRADGRETDVLGMVAERRGAGAVLATLWDIADQSTPDLMFEFYKEREGIPGKTKAEALRQAQLKFLHRGSNPKFAHPKFWAPFILIGNFK